MNPKKISTLKIPALFLALILSLVPLGLANANDEINATLTAAQSESTIGDHIPLSLTVTHPNGYRVLPLQFQDSTWGEFEIQDMTPPQVTVNPDGTETTTQTIYATLWTPGEYTTPELTLSLSDSNGAFYEVSTAPLELSVASVLVEGDTELRDIKPQAALPFPAVWPWVLGGVLLVLLVVIASGWLLRRWWLRRKEALVNAPDNRLPHEVAFDELAHIEDLNLPSQQRFKEHYTLISDVLRKYVERSFQIPMLDRTTAEIRRSLKIAPFSQDNKRVLVGLLNEADLVKFAKVRPEIPLSQNFLTQARRLIGETRPLDVLSGNGSGQAPNNGNKTEHIDLQHNKTPLMEAK